MYNCVVAEAGRCLDQAPRGQGISAYVRTSGGVASQQLESGSHGEPQDARSITYLHASPITSCQALLMAMHLHALAA